ncbi:MAG TPA: hypothetical protein VIR63_00385, partial [Pontiella sp.]
LRKKLQFSSGDFKEKADEAASKSAPQFIEKNRELLRTETNLNQEQISDLIQMTPIFWRSSDDAKAAVMKLENLMVTISFTLLTLKKSDVPTQA